MHLATIESGQPLTPKSHRVLLTNLTAAQRLENPNLTPAQREAIQVEELARVLAKQAKEQEDAEWEELREKEVF